MIPVIIGLLFFFNSAFAEIRFLCPAPTSPDSHQSPGSCHAGRMRFEKQYTDVFPGFLTIQYEEPVVHLGAVVRIELIDMETRLPACKLLDQVPHNDNLKNSTNSLCMKNDYPLGKCGTTSQITVDIPDIKCSKCALQLTQILINADNDFCEYYECPYFRSCANIRIHPRNPSTSLTIANCTNNYNSVKTSWGVYGPIPYELSMELDEHFLIEYFLFFDNMAENIITYEIDIPKDKVKVLNMLIYRHRKARAPMDTLQVYKDDTNRYRGIINPKKNNNFRGGHAWDGPVIRIGYIILETGEQDFHYTAKLTPQVRDAYSKRSTSYSLSGLVNSTRYVGPTARSTEFVYPRGHCAGIKHQYGVLLMNSTNEPAGMITYVTANNITSFVGVFPKDGTKWTINLDSTHTFSHELVWKNTFWGNLPSGNKLPKSVVVDGNRTGEIYRLNGTFIKGLQALIYHEGLVHGIALLSLVGTEDYRLQYFLKNVGSRTPSPSAVYLTYPTHANIIHNATSGIVDIPMSNFRYGGWSTDYLFKGNGDEFMLHTGRFGIISKTGNDDRYVFSGEFDVPSETFCKGSEHVFCKRQYLQKHFPTPVKSGIISPYGWVSVRLKEAATYYIRMYLRDIQHGETVDVGYFYSGLPDNTDERVLIGMNFEYSKVEEKTATLSTIATMSADQNRLWLDGKLNLAVRLTKSGIVSTQPPRLPVISSTVKTTSKTTSKITTKVGDKSSKGRSSISTSSQFSTQPTSSPPRSLEQSSVGDKSTARPQPPTRTPRETTTSSAATVTNTLIVTVLFISYSFITNSM